MWEAAAGPVRKSGRFASCGTQAARAATTKRVEREVIRKAIIKVNCMYYKSFFQGYCKGYHMEDSDWK